MLKANVTYFIVREYGSYYDFRVQLPLGTEICTRTSIYLFSNADYLKYLYLWNNDLNRAWKQRRRCVQTPVYSETNSNINITKF